LQQSLVFCPFLHHFWQKKPFENSGKPVHDCQTDRIMQRPFYGVPVGWYSGYFLSNSAL